MNDEFENEEINDAESNSQGSGKNRLLKEVFSWVKTILLALIFALLITQFVIVNAKVPTGSMIDTINQNDRLIASRLSYIINDPQRYDIVVFRYPDDEDTLFIKRIIGLPGETIDIKDGKVYVNNSETPLNDSFILEPMMDNPNVPTHYEVPEGCYFMLGDNRNDSKDSRFWVNKYVAKDKILGKAIFKYYSGEDHFPQFKLFEKVKE